MTKNNKLYVVSLGGSLIIPGEIDKQFLRKFKQLIEGEIKRGSRFIIVCGGGTISRMYQQALHGIVPTSDEDLDWMGIAATHLNARLMQLTFGPLAHHTIVSDPNKKVAFKEKILIAGGWKPGRSSDDGAVRLAKMYGSETVINLSNIYYVYNKDPNKYKNAVPIEQMDWKTYGTMFGTQWSPGGHFPFDPVAATFARKHKQRVVLTNGTDIVNLKKILSGDQKESSFKATTIHP